VRCLYLFLDGVKVEVSLLGHNLVAVGIHDDGQMLIDKSNSEHVTVLSVCFVQEVDCVGRKFSR